MKKLIGILIAVAVIVTAGFGIYHHYFAPKYETPQSRTEKLNEVAPHTVWSIAAEETFGDYILCGAYGGGQTALAVFQADGEGYDFRSATYGYENYVLNDTIVLDDKFHEVFWFNVPEAAYAEITYTLDDFAREPMKFDLSKTRFACICTEDFRSYSRNVVCYDSVGNICEN